MGDFQGGQSPSTLTEVAVHIAYRGKQLFLGGRGRWREFALLLPVCPDLDCVSLGRVLIFALGLWFVSFGLGA